MKNPSLDSLTKYARAFRYTGRLRPERDWLMLLSITAGLFLVSIVWNVLFFISLAGAESAPQAKPAVHAVSSAAAVANVQDIFKARATEQNNYQQTYHFVDPSL